MSIETNNRTGAGRNQPEMVRQRDEPLSPMDSTEIDESSAHASVTNASSKIHAVGILLDNDEFHKDVAIVFR